MTTLNLSIVTTGDDVREEGGVISAANWPLNVGTWGNTIKNAGFRFQGVTVPQGATISSAVLSLPIVSSSGTINFRLYGAAVDNASSWSTSFLPSGVARTTAYTALTSAPVGTVNLTITSVVQEIVNRSGWASGNSMGLPLLWQGAAGDSNDFIGISEYSYDSGNTATLSITYSVGTNYSLTASAITTSAVSIEAPTLTQRNTLAASGITAGSPTLQNAAVQQIHALIATAPSVGPPTIASPTFSSNHLLSANTLAAQSPNIGSPALSQKHNVSVSDIVAQSASVENVTITQAHNISASDFVSGAPQIENPALSQFGGLTANDLMAQAFVESASLSQKHSLIGVDVSSGNAVLEAPGITQNHQIAANNITTGLSFVESPSTASTYNFEALDVESGVVAFGNASLAQNHSLQSQSINTDIVGVDETFISQRHNLIADILMTLGVVIGSPNLFMSGERVITRKTHTAFRKVPLYVPKRNRNYTVN